LRLPERKTAREGRWTRGGPTGILDFKPNSINTKLRGRKTYAALIAEARKGMDGTSLSNTEEKEGEEKPLSAVEGQKTTRWGGAA